MRNIKLLLAGTAMVLAGFIFPMKAGAWMNSDYFQTGANQWYCTSTGTVTTQAGVSTSSPTWSLLNPPGSNVKLVVQEIGVVLVSTANANTFFMVGYSTGVAMSTNVVTGNIAGVAVGISTATTSPVAQCKMQGILPVTPRVARYIGGVQVSSLAGENPYTFTDLTDGKLVVPPGVIVSLQTSASVNIQSHIVWREVSQ